MDVTYPLVDPETGEFLANNDEERLALVNELAELLVFAAKASQRVNDLRRMLEYLMHEGEAVAIDGWGVRVQPGAAPRRAVNRQAVLTHAETLAPLGLGPREVTSVSVEYPMVSELTAASTRRRLGQIGLTPETFLLTGDPGSPRVVVDPPEGS